MRVAIVNQLINCALWYMLHLWPRDTTELVSFDRWVCDFVWSKKDIEKHPRVNYTTITYFREKGGLALISIKTHTHATIGMVMLWMVQEGETMLQCILHSKIVDLSEHRWGRRDYTWLVNHNQTRPVGESKLWYNFCGAWIMLKKNITPLPPANWEERLALPLWASHLLHKKPMDASCKKVKQKKLCKAGVETLDSIPDSNRELKSWETLQAIVDCCYSEKAYDKLCANINLENNKVANANSTIISLCMLCHSRKVIAFGRSRSKEKIGELLITTRLI